MTTHVYIDYDKEYDILSIFRIDKPASYGVDRGDGITEFLTIDGDIPVGIMVYDYSKHGEFEEDTLFAGDLLNEKDFRINGIPLDPY